MASGVRVAVVGGGSSYTPELMAGFIRHYHEMPIEKITLIDVPMGHYKQEIVRQFSQRLWDQANLPIRLESTLDRHDALVSADFVCHQFRVGGLQARQRDETLPLKYHALGQETCGAGGFAKALRTIPVALDIARELEAHNPSAWIMNFTNPSGMVTEAILKYTGIRTIGLCNVPITMQREIAHRFHADPDQVELDMVGLNHLSFVRRVYVKGEDVTQRALHGSPNDSSYMANVPSQEWGADLIQAIQMIPNDYLRYYWFAPDMIQKEEQRVQSGLGTRATEVLRIEKDLFARYQDPALVTLPEELSRRGGAYYSDVAVNAMVAIANDQNRPMVVNVSNGQTIADLPSDAVVEVTAKVNHGGAHPLYPGPLPLTVRGLVQQVKTYEALTIEAAVTVNRDLALAGLIANPLVPSAKVAEHLLHDILEANREDLPEGWT